MSVVEACKAAFERGKLMRRIILFVVLGLVIASVVVGLINLVDLTDAAVRFLLAVVALLNVPIAYYFYQCGKS